jgi:hypothetical protein
VAVVDDPAGVRAGAVECAALAVVAVDGDVALVVVRGLVVAGVTGATAGWCTAVVNVTVGAPSTAAGPMAGVAKWPNAKPTSEPDGGW